MSETFSGDSALYPALLTLVTDVDPKKAASVRPGFEGLAHRTEYLKAGRNLQTNVARQLRNPIVRYSENGVAPGWTWQYGSASGLRDTHVADAAGASIITWIVSAPQGAVLKRVRVYINPANTHPSMPVTKPRVVTRKTFAKSFTAAVTLDDEIDATATTGTYEVTHYIEAGFDLETVDNENHLYTVTFSSEADLNSRPDLVVLGAEILIDTTIRDDGAA